MAARKIMIQGTGSYVGKSVVTAALCRYFRQEGFRVAPFKAQNMSNNSYVTAEGGEIGRAQAFQAMACGIEPTVEMNPILLKPSSDMGAQVIVLGKAIKVMGPREYHDCQPHLLGVIRECLDRLSQRNDIIVIEGAGSPAEVNLRAFDIANMTVAMMAAAPVILVGDINLGGVFAWLVGTLELLTDEERSLVAGFLINKFRGDVSLLEDGLKFLEARTGKKVLGVLPFVADLQVPEEDCVPEFKWRRMKPGDPGKLSITVILLPHISNSTDFDSLEAEPDVALQYLAHVPPPSHPFPDLLILPGSKSTMADLAHLRSSGIAEYVYSCREARVPLIGICGGYQMLGRQLLDPEGVESLASAAEGLGLLDVITTFGLRKETVQVRAVSLEYQQEIAGYEIHMGRTESIGAARRVFHVTEECGKPISRSDGTKSENGSVWGTYIHGVFDSPGFRRGLLNGLRQRRGLAPVALRKSAFGDEALDRLAALIREHVDLAKLEQLVNGML